MKEPGKKIWKTIGVVLGKAALFAAAFFLIIVLRLFLGFNDDYSTHDLSKYESYLDYPLAAREFMPALDNCGEYQEAGISRRERVQFIFGHHSVCLFLRYSEEEYARQKEQLEKRYTFYEESNGVFEDVSGSIGSYRVRMVNTGDSYSDLKEGKFIGFNDEMNAVLYMYYYDDDLDTIMNMDKTLRKYFFVPRSWRISSQRIAIYELF